MSCFIIATLGGGGSLFDYFSALGRELDSRGHRVIILVDGQHHEAEDTEHNPSILTWPSARATEWRDARFLHALIKRHRPACIIGNFSAVNICTLVGWLDRVPARVAWGHTVMKAVVMDTAMPRWKLEYLVRRKRLILKCATHHMAVCEALTEELQSTFGVPKARIRVFRFLLPDPQPVNVPIRRNVVLCASRHDPCKGQSVLIQAVPLIRAACPDAIVEFLGTGSMRGANESLAASLGVQDACRFLSALPQPQLRERMASAACMAVPSLADAFPLVNIEAASVGTPVVGSAVGGIKEMIIDGETGFLVPPDDPRALAEKIVLILKSEDLRNRLGRAARERFETTFSMRNMPQHADFFESIIGDTGS
jgi:glycosyltransferase involved in cell wall biosynthesis